MRIGSLTPPWMRLRLIQDLDSPRFSCSTCGGAGAAKVHTANTQKTAISWIRIVRFYGRVTTTVDALSSTGASDEKETSEISLISVSATLQPRPYMRSSLAEDPSHESVHSSRRRRCNRCTLVALHAAYDKLISGKGTDREGWWTSSWLLCTSMAVVPLMSGDRTADC